MTNSQILKSGCPSAQEPIRPGIVSVRPANQSYIVTDDNMQQQFDFEMFNEQTHPHLYSPNYDLNMQGFMESQGGFPFNRTTAHDSYPQNHGYESYNDMQQFHNDKHSPNFYPVSSPELHAPPSNLSTASGPSATSSVMGSPYSGHSHTVPAMVQGLAIGLQNSTQGPSIAGFDNFPSAQEYSFPNSGMDTENAFTEMKPGFVGECANVLRERQALCGVRP